MICSHLRRSQAKLVLVVPGSGLVKRQAEAEGLDKIFVAAGFGAARGGGARRRHDAAHRDGPDEGRGIDNAAYYRLVGDDPRYYMDYTGTGNTLNMRHPHVLQLIMDSLRYWVTEMHVDGFRFDLASTLARDSPQMTEFFARLAISLTAAKSPSEAIGKPASHTSTPRRASWLAMTR